MKLRSVALALALTFGFTGLAEAKKPPVYTKHKAPKVKSKKYNAKKANRASKKALAKRRKGNS
jgi:hypothetical protein